MKKKKKKSGLTKADFIHFAIFSALVKYTKTAYDEASAVVKKLKDNGLIR